MRAQHVTGQHTATQPTASDAPGPDPCLPRHGCAQAATDPTGTAAAYICDRGGVPQLWTGPLSGAGGPRLLDPAPDPVTAVSWSPDGRWIAYTSAPDGAEHGRVLCIRPDGTGRRLLAGANPRAAAYLGCWSRDGSALAVTEVVPVGDGSGHSHGLLAASLVDPEGVRPPRRLATESGAATLRVCDLTPDGRLALLRRGPRGHREAVLLRLADLVEAGTFPVADGDPWIGRFAPDGRTVWLRSDAEREFAALLAVALNPDGSPGPAGARTVRVAAQRSGADLELLTVAPDGGTALLGWNQQGRSSAELVRLGPEPGAATTMRQIPLPHEVLTRVDADGTGGLLLSLSGSRSRPGIWSLPAAPGAEPQPAPWTSEPVPGAVGPRAIGLTARDGLPLSGWYYRAPASGPDDAGPAPCVVHLHGGPESQERPVLEPLFQELLSRGFDVFAPNVRGSSGFGRSFVDADLGEGRFAAVDDVADCALHLVGLGLADPGRLAVMGRSYGGYLVLAALVRHPELFRTGVDICGISDFATFFAGTEPWIAESAAAKYGHPERDRLLLRQLSPMTGVDALRAPLLAVHGAQDSNVPIGESEQIVAAARARGVTASLLELPDEGHDFVHEQSRALVRSTVAAWLERHLE
ncbi:alpha/beta fold hydrolase [Streptacidiphilus sp. N1-5]|uniref:Alpha/beta fold hydrolase n=1 Tax=Streptacidiphilus cavernicola TaxID=3342716 RepID=A0ABV6UJH5_9ACTN